MAAPIKTRKEDLVENLHGTKVPDPYRWLEGDPDSPEIKEWLEQQSERAAEYFKQVPIRNTLRDELKRLSEIDSIGTPHAREGRYFYMERKANEDMGILYMKEGLESESKVLIDPNTFSKDKTTTLSGWAPSRNGKLLVYGLSTSGNDKRELHVMDIEAGKDLPDLIPDDIYPAIDTWNADSTGFWYTRRDPKAPTTGAEAKFHKRIFFHTLGTDHKQDELIWGEGFGKESGPGFSLSHDGKYIVGSVYGQEKGEEWTELYIKETDAPARDFALVLKRIPRSEFGGHIHRDKLYVMTNYETPNWKMMVTTVESALSGKPEFTDFIPESQDILQSYKFVGDRLFTSSLHDVHSVIREYALDGKLVRDIPLPAMGTAGGFSSEAEGEELFFSFSSYAYPYTIYRIDMKTDEIKEFHQMESSYDTKSIITDQVWYDSKDGTRIPMFLVHKKDLVKDGNNPVMLYGYGGFNISMLPSYITRPIPFIERGGIYAVANLRGGGEFGKEWHEAGMKKNKQNVFDDFIAAAEYLISEKYTRKERIAIQGGSNGGLLVSAVMTQRPDLVEAVICQVPVADMLRYHLYHGGRHWIPDYGNPDDPDMFKYLFGYSPYHNVKNGEKYPATLIMTSDGDDRVHPLHAYKLAARLQEANASENPIYMRVEMKAGHSGAHAVSRAVEQDADMWSFVFDQLGMVKK